MANSRLRSRHQQTIEVEYDPKSVAARTRPANSIGCAIRDRTTRRTPVAQYKKPPYPNYHEHDGLVFIGIVSPYVDSQTSKSYAGFPSVFRNGFIEKFRYGEE